MCYDSAVSCRSLSLLLLEKWNCSSRSSPLTVLPGLAPGLFPSLPSQEPVNQPLLWACSATLLSEILLGSWCGGSWLAGAWPDLLTAVPQQK